MHGSVNGWSGTEAGLIIPRSIRTSLLLNHLSQFALCNPTCFLSSGSWVLAFPFVTLPCSLDLTPGTSFLITASTALFLFCYLFCWELDFPSGLISVLHQLSLQHPQHPLFDLRMPINSICLNSMSRTQTFNEKTKTEWGTSGLFEEIGFTYIGQQDFSAHNKYSEMEDT